MMTQERKALLVALLAAQGRLVARDLAAELAVSEDTIRRDLRDLAAAGRLTRVHGGALPASPTVVPLAQRQAMAMDEMVRLGRVGARLIQPGMIVLIDGGSTHQALVAALPSDLACTVVTHSPIIAAALEPLAGVVIVLLGGTVFRHSMVALGQTTAEALALVHADLCLLGVTGLHPQAGLTTGHHEEARLKAAMIARSAETVVLATADQIGAASPWTVAALAQIHILVTTGPAPDWLPAGLRHLAA